MHFSSVALTRLPGRAEQPEALPCVVVVAVVTAAGVVVAVVTEEGAAVVGAGPDPEAVTAMSAQFQNSSPNEPPVLQQELSHVAQLATQKGHQSSGFHPSAWNAAALRW